jgi:hypothetical protein
MMGEGAGGWSTVAHAMQTALALIMMMVHASLVDSFGDMVSQVAQLSTSVAMKGCYNVRHEAMHAYS